MSTSATESTPTLTEDLIGPGVRPIAKAINHSERRTRYLIDRHGLPVFRIGGLFYARRSQLDKFFSADGQSDGAA